MNFALEGLIDALKRGAVLGTGISRTALRIACAPLIDGAYSFSPGFNPWNAHSPGTAPASAPARPLSGLRNRVPYSAGRRAAPCGPGPGWTNPLWRHTRSDAVPKPNG